MDKTKIMRDLVHLRAEAFELQRGADVLARTARSEDGRAAWRAVRDHHAGVVEGLLAASQLMWAEDK